MWGRHAEACLLRERQWQSRQQHFATVGSRSNFIKCLLARSGRAWQMQHPLNVEQLVESVPTAELKGIVWFRKYIFLCFISKGCAVQEL